MYGLVNLYYLIFSAGCVAKLFMHDKHAVKCPVCRKEVRNIQPDTIAFLSVRLDHCLAEELAIAVNEGLRSWRKLFYSIQPGLDKKTVPLPQYGNSKYRPSLV